MVRTQHVAKSKIINVTDSVGLIEGHVPVLVSDSPMVHRVQLAAFGSYLTAGAGGDPAIRHELLASAWYARILSVWTNDSDYSTQPPNGANARWILDGARLIRDVRPFLRTVRLESLRRHLQQYIAEYHGWRTHFAGDAWPDRSVELLPEARHAQAEDGHAADRKP